MHRYELSNDIKMQLKDIQKFNLEIADNGWHIHEKSLNNLNLSEINFNQSSFIECDFSDVKLNQSTISATRFESISFADTDFSYSKFDQVQFINCNFNLCTQLATNFSRCRFINCQYINIKSNSTVFNNCDFEMFDGQNSTFETCRFIQTNFIVSKFQKIRFHGVTFDRMTLSNCQSNKLIFSNIMGQQLKFEGGSCSYSGFSLSEFIGLGFFNCQIQGITLDAFKITHFRLQDCPEVSNFHLMKSECTRPLIKNCEIVSEFSFYQSTVNDLDFINSTLTYFKFAESTLHGSNSISDCECHGISFADSEIEGLAIIHCQFKNYLILDRARFKNLQLQQIDYAGDLEINAEEVTYENSSCFHC